MRANNSFKWKPLRGLAQALGRTELVLVLACRAARFGSAAALTSAHRLAGLPVGRSRGSRAKHLAQRIVTALSLRQARQERRNAFAGQPLVPTL